MKKKLNLDDLKVKSFITKFEDTAVETVKGGKAPESVRNCPIDEPDEPKQSDFFRCYSYRFWCY
ncbi:MAG: pinensin family lanthipeptide [Bacteroidota bacterium]